MIVRPAANAMIARKPTIIAGLSERRAGFNHSSSAFTVRSATGSAGVTDSARVTGVADVAGVTVVGAGAGSNGDSPGCSRVSDELDGMIGDSVGSVGETSTVETGAPHEPQKLSPSATRSPH